MMVVTFSYAAFNTELIITGDALIEAIKEETLATYVDSLANKSDDVVKLGYGTRYVGNNPNNYVYYNGELWRIVGVFDVNTQNGPERLTKIMKPDPVEILSYNSAYYTNNNNGKNDFYDSTIYNYLFKNFYYKSYDQYNMYQCVNGSSMASTSCAYKGLSVNSGAANTTIIYKSGLIEDLVVSVIPSKATIPMIYSYNTLIYNGVINYNGDKYTYYSQRVLPLQIILKY